MSQLVRKPGRSNELFDLHRVIEYVLLLSMVTAIILKFEILPLANPSNIYGGLSIIEDLPNAGTFWMGIVCLIGAFVLYSKQRPVSTFDLDDRLAQAREKERIDLASDIHDGPLQDLYATRFLLDDPNDPLGALLMKVRTELRDITMRLQPAEIESCLEDELSHLVSWLNEKHQDVKLSFSLSGKTPVIPCAVSLTLFRMVRTALSNIYKHSEASSATLAISSDHRSVTLSIIDNGKGFDVEAPINSTTEHFGLFLIRHYASEIGAKASIKSEVGVGTKVDIRWENPASATTKNRLSKTLLSWISR